MIAILACRRPRCLAVCLASIRAFNGKWIEQVCVFDNGAINPEIQNVANLYEVEYQLIKTTGSGRSRANAARAKIKDIFLERNQSEPIFFVDEDVVFGPNAFTMMNKARLVGEYNLLCGIHLRRTSARGRPVFVAEYTFRPLTRMAEAFWLTTRKTILDYEHSWIPNVGFFKAVVKGGGKMAFLEGVPVQHIGASCPTISRHIPTEHMLLRDQDKGGNPIQPLPEYEIDFANPNFEEIEKFCNERKEE